ncbi:MBL fold metallo-hydrolase [Vibrio genomosp. F10 str. ZF-129]|uniref:MBL fold metallo-hydrolase n=1 Tax=Vibrio genomosp. F10 str. ZF-129 TaxID=1187848 RepID=A0A1E5BEI1_9VIBR|nr:MBL fold metallo-hydrolase [Vibrio genomosp. F10]OEE33953.1 MBL fold metallo-hydrolase [Vibrio genomosp. F10 str. ZF-129]
MKIHHLRSATFIIESGEKFILIDPMLGKKGSMPPFSVIKAKAAKNPTVEMPSNADELLNKVTHTLITHSQTLGIKALQHGDHLDPAGEAFLTSRNIPVATPAKDKAYLEKYGLTINWGIKDWETIDFLDGKLTAVPALHGHGWIHKVMANGVGFFLELPNEPSIYISGDTVLTDDVKRALTELKPDITVVAAGRARLDVGQPLLMSIDEVMEFIRLSPNKVVANHMEALNHCAVTRAILKEAIDKNGLSDKVLIPADGETLEF